MTQSLENYCYGLLGEEAGEINQELGKAQRFGMNHKSPKESKYRGSTPKERLTLEMGDMLAAIQFAVECGFIDGLAVKVQCDEKLALHRNPDFRNMTWIPDNMKVG